MGYLIEQNGPYKILTFLQKTPYIFGQKKFSVYKNSKRKKVFVRTLSKMTPFCNENVMKM